MVNYLLSIVFYQHVPKEKDSENNLFLISFAAAPNHFLVHLDAYRVHYLYRVLELHYRRGVLELPESSPERRRVNSAAKGPVDQ